MLRVRVKVEGQQEVLKSLRKFGAAGDEAAKLAFGRICQSVVPRAKALTPVSMESGGDAGALRDSIRTTKPTKTRAGNVSAGVVAGGAPLRRLATERGRVLPGQYGSIVHEDLTLRHAQGEPKFLEKAFFQVVDQAPGELLAELDKLVGKDGA